MERPENKRFERQDSRDPRSNTDKRHDGDRAYMPGWVRDFRKNPIPRLLHCNNPAIHYNVYWDVIGLDKEQPLMLDSLDKANSNPAALRFLGQTTSSNDEQPAETVMHGLEFLSHLIRMNKLVQFSLNKENPLIQADIVKLMGYIKDDGRFPLLYHHHAHACWILLKLGLGGNRLLEKSIYWLAKKQRDDGGWLHRSMVPDGVDYSAASSCIWTTMEIMNMLIKRPGMLKKIDMTKACEFLVNHIEQPNHTRFLHHQNAWNNISIGTGEESMFAGGTLKLLEVLAGCRYNMSDHRIQKLIKWLKAIQLDDGLFPREVGKLSIGDEWVTIRALAVYKKLKFQR